MYQYGYNKKLAYTPIDVHQETYNKNHLEKMFT